MSRITQKGATGPLAVQAGGSYQNATDANLTTLAGTRWDLEDGRELILVSVGSTAIASIGTFCQDAAIVANHQGVAVSAFTAYSNNGNVPPSVTTTTLGAAVAANQYQGGFLVVDTGPGGGQTLLIAGNTITNGSTATFTLEDSPNTALTTSSTFCLIPPHGENVVIMPTVPTGAVTGVTLYPLAAGQAAGGTTGTPSFGFLTSKGLTGLVSDAGVATVGQAITYSTVTAGSCTVIGASQATLGYAQQTAVSGKSRTVFVNL